MKHSDFNLIFLASSLLLNESVKKVLCYSKTLTCVIMWKWNISAFLKWMITVRKCWNKTLHCWKHFPILSGQTVSLDATWNRNRSLFAPFPLFPWNCRFGLIVAVYEKKKKKKPALAALSTFFYKRHLLLLNDERFYKFLSGVFHSAFRVWG